MTSVPGAAPTGTFVAASEVATKEHTRVFEIADELAATTLLDWSEPIQLRLQVKEDGTYDLICRVVR